MTRKQIGVFQPIEVRKREDRVEVVAELQPFSQYSYAGTTMLVTLTFPVGKPDVAGEMLAAEQFLALKPMPLVVYVEEGEDRLMDRPDPLMWSIIGSLIAGAIAVAGLNVVAWWRTQKGRLS